MNKQIKETPHQTYLVWVSKEGKDCEKLLLTSTIRIIGEGSNVKLYLVEVTTKQGLEVRSLPPEVFSSRRAWIEWLKEVSWFGSPDDLELYKAFLFEGAKRKNTIILENFTGRFVKDDIDLLVTMDMLMVKGGENYSFEGDTVHIKGKERQYFITKKSNYEAMCLFNKFQPDIDTITPQEFLSTWYSLFKDQVLLSALLGWLLAVFFMPEVIKARGQRFFPYYFLQGNTEAGKTALLRCAMKLFGIDYISNYCEISPFVEYFHLSRTSLVPIWRDEYRERGKYVMQKESIARSLYTMDQIEKGISSTDTILYRPLTTWLLSGEGKPRDAAYQRRCIQFTLRKDQKIPLTDFLKIEDAANRMFPSMLLSLWKQGFNEEVWKKIYNMELVTPNSPNEEKIAYATLAALFGEEVGIKAVNAANEYWAKSDDETSSRDDTVNQFWTEIYQYFMDRNYFSIPTNGKPKAAAYFEQKDGEIIIKYAPLIELIVNTPAWKDKTTLDRVSVRNLVLEKYDIKIALKRINEKVAKVLVIPANKVTEADNLQDIVSQLEIMWDEYTEKESSKKSFSFPG